MSYPPGSFSKNFAWHGTGLRKLHRCVRAGFQGTLAAVDRQSFRQNSGIEGAIILIPINFFLHNRDGRLSVDELVFQAIDGKHSMIFDRLALFALNLSLVGSGRDAQSKREILRRPAMWANELVRERLWSNGAWQRDALSDASLDEFLEDRLDAQLTVRIKCRNNYRHIFQLCNYWPTAFPIINSGSERWISSAMFLTWDRYILDGGKGTRKNLLSLVESHELYKLLGVSQEFTLSQADHLVDLYRSAGQLDRFTSTKSKSVQFRATPSILAPEAVTERDLGWLEQEKADGVVERHTIEKKLQKRDRKKAAALKRHYNNTCQFCGLQLDVGETHYYSEAAHIKGLGEPHNGPDKVSNMLVLCPNHHLQFDRGVLRLERAGSEYKISSQANNHPLNGKKVTLKHALAEDCVKYHFAWFR